MNQKVCLLTPVNPFRKIHRESNFHGKRKSFLEIHLEILNKIINHVHCIPTDLLPPPPANEAVLKPSRNCLQQFVIVDNGKTNFKIMHIQ